MAGFIDSCEHVKGLAPRTVDRYRAALNLFKSFALVHGLTSLDRASEATVEDFVKCLRRKERTRNGAAVAKRKPYAIDGVKFVLSTCRTAMNWARKHRHLPPYSENPFSSFPIESLRDRSEAKSLSR